MDRGEAIRRVRAWNLDADDIEVLSVLIPELKENEDERIRNIIYNSLQGYYINKRDSYSSVFDKDKCTKEWLEVKDWLEKQGQVKESLISQQVNKTCKENSNSLTGEWSEEDEKIYRRINDLIHASAFVSYDVDEDGKELGEYAKITNWFKSLKDRFT